MPGHALGIWCLDTTAHLAATGGMDRQLLLWDLAGGQQSPGLRLQHDACDWLGHATGVQLQADGRQLLSCHTDGGIVVWDLRTGMPELLMHIHGAPGAQLYGRQPQSPLAGGPTTRQPAGS
jgi:WD40 repeat protein